MNEDWLREFEQCLIAGGIRIAERVLSEEKAIYVLRRDVGDSHAVLRLPVRPENQFIDADTSAHIVLKSYERAGFPVSLPAVYGRRKL